jgi:WD40 repeat protein
LRVKYKGHANKSPQIKASFSPNGEFIICGSDDGSVFIWRSVPGKSKALIEKDREAGAETLSSAKDQGDGGAFAAAREKNSAFETFQVTTSEVVTVALFAPESTHRSLTASSSAHTINKPDDEDTPFGGSRRLAQGFGAVGQVIVASGYSGEIRIYENVGLPQPV